MLLNDLLKKLNLQEVEKNIEINDISDLKSATKENLSYIDGQKHLDELKATKAGGVFVSKELSKYVPKETIAIVCDNPHLCIAYASAYFKRDLLSDDFIEPKIAQGCNIAKTATIGSNTTIDKNVTILPGAVIGENVRIGEGSVIYPNVTVYNDTKIGKNCIIHAGTVIGSDGFGYAHTKTGEHIKIYHNGNVILEDNVEIGANCTIDRAVFGSTIIKKGTKIDNLIQIGHNCIIGENSILVSQVGLSGSTELGRNVIMGGQSATAGHLKIGDFATIAARGGVSKSIEGGKVYGGFPLMLQKDWLRLQAKILKLIKKQEK
ncbi:MAG: UDP-3-O-(3-hydroxymyristoyl)glucosamine N-acyltransferase [Epsilonproteobacteria bacterium]|nr:UDP-3-O-(3-hydroxymyristoyl)glucosamine N-acyltransferase [Campylobacterota bacterium]